MSPAAAPDGLLAIADELYGLPPAQFTGARDRRAAELRNTDRTLAAAVKKLRRPAAAAWAVNLLVRREAEQVAQVLAVGEALREAQARLDGDELRALTTQRRQLTAAVTVRARALSREAGQRLTETVARQVEGTLTAAMVDPEAAAAVRSGLLVTPLQATGVDHLDVAAALAVPEAAGFTATATATSVSGTEDAAPTPPTKAGRPDLTVVPDPEAELKRLRAAETAATAAEVALAEQQAVAEAGQQRLDELEARTIEIQAGIDELRRRIADLEAEADQVDEEVAEAEEEHAEAQEAVKLAETALVRSVDEVERLRSRTRAPGGESRTRSDETT